MKHGHLTEQRKHFVEAYCRLGNGTLAAKEAGYKDSPSLVNQASKLKRELSTEISEELRSSFMNAAPKALSNTQFRFYPWSRVICNWNVYGLFSFQATGIT